MRLAIDVEIGNQNGLGKNIFYFYIISTEALQKYYSDRNVYSLKHYFLVNHYNWQEISEEIVNLILSCEEETWEKTVASLCRYFNWEYENHIEVSCDLDDNDDLCEDIPENFKR